MSDIIEYMFKDLPVDITTVDDEVWFDASDVCDILGIINVSQAMDRLSDDKKGIYNVYTSGGAQDKWFVTEAGMYNLIFRSNKPEAEAFTDWVTREVLPALRKTGHYETPAYKARMLENIRAVPDGYFSILQELYSTLVYPLEAEGVIIPEDTLPDVSVGRMFCKLLRDKHGIDTDILPTYRHVYSDGRTVYPKAYPNNLLSEFRDFVRGWQQDHLIKYLKDRGW